MYETSSGSVYWQDAFYLWGPKVLWAILILIVAWLLARAAKWAIARVVDRVPVLQRHNEMEPGKTVGGLIGDVAFWLILLIGILGALQQLGLSVVLAPVQQLTDTTFAFIPNLIAAGLIFFIGLVIAKIVRRVVESALLVANADRWLRNAGILETVGTAPASTTEGPIVASGRPSISRSIGTIVFFLIMIPVTIMALDALKIEVIAGPAREMLETIMIALPKVVGSLILLAIGYMVGKIAKSATEQILPSMGFDRAVSAMGISTESTTPSRTIGTVVMVAIILFFAIKAAELLDSPIIATMLAQALELGGRVLGGTGVILIGVVIARIVSSVVSGAAGEGWLPAVLKWSIIALSVAMGLRFMGLANEIVIIAFSSIIGSAAVACALAFGLGGRPTAHKLLEQWTADNAPPRAPARPRAPRAPTTPGDSQPPLV